MINHSAQTREETPHTIKSTTNTTVNHNGARKNTISNALKRRAQTVMRNKSIDAGTRTVIRYGLETNDPWLAELVRRADAGETIIDNLYLPPITSAKMIQAKKKLKLWWKSSAGLVMNLQINLRRCSS